MLSLAGFADETPTVEASQIDQETIEEIIVWGRAQSQQGSALSASSGLVGYADFSTRPMQRVGEMVEVVPGMVATQHSGGGKANQYYLRGMNLDHGTDFSAYFEGMPLNLRAHAHGQGYLDLNFLIPEIVRSVRYAKGPYSADRGDFSTAGTTAFEIYDHLDAPFVEVAVGSDNYRRTVGAASWALGDGHVLAAAELMRNDGPWDLASDVEKTNLLVKLTQPIGEAEGRLLLSFYDNEWRSTDQVPQRLVSSGAIDRFGFVDPTIGGESSRLNIVAGIEADKFSVGAYVSQYKLNLFGNFTYFLEFPLMGDQHEQVDRRDIYGGHGEYRWVLGDDLTLRIGGDLRYDDIKDANLHLTTARVRRQVVRADEVEWLSVGGFAELEWRITDRLRTTLGLRGDVSDYEVNSRLAANSGSDTETHVTPKFSLAFELNDHVELYANWGEGFHTNDVRGRTISVDPLSGGALTPIELFVEQAGAEAGIRVEGWHGVASSLTYFWLESDSELLFVGDSGATEPSDGSRRTGLELNFFWNINANWTVDLIGTWVDSKFVDVPSGQDHIPNAHGQVFGAGITYVEPEGLTASLRLRHFGKAPLVEDDSVSHDDTNVLNAGVSYDFGRVTVGLDLINVLDSDDDDIAYFFESQLANEAAPVEDVHFHPVGPFSVRASIRVEF